MIGVNAIKWLHFNKPIKYHVFNIINVTMQIG